MAGKVGELFIDLVVDAASGNLSVRQLITAIGDLETRTLGGMIGVSKIADSLAGLAAKSMDTAAALSDLSGVTGVSPDKLQKWGLAFESMRIPSSEVAQGIRGVQKAMSDVGKGHMPSVFRDLGISPRVHGKAKDYFTLLEEMANNKVFWRAYGLGPGQQREWLAQLGMSENMLVIMKEMRANKFEKRLGEQMGLTPEEIIRLTQAKDTTFEIQQMSKHIGLDMIGGAMGMADWLRDALAVLTFIHKKEQEYSESKKKLGEQIKSSPEASAMVDKLPLHIRAALVPVMAAGQMLIPEDLKNALLKDLTINFYGSERGQAPTWMGATRVTKEDIARGHVAVTMNRPVEEEPQ